MPKSKKPRRGSVTTTVSRASASRGQKHSVTKDSKGRTTNDTLLGDKFDKKKARVQIGDKGLAKRKKDTSTASRITGGSGNVSQRSATVKHGPDSKKDIPKKKKAAKKKTTPTKRKRK